MEDGGGFGFFKVKPAARLGGLGLRKINPFDPTKYNFFPFW